MMPDIPRRGRPRATDINEAHRLARQCAGSAVEHAIRCGELLQEVKASLKHGEFGPWIEAHCGFDRSTATRYMKAARQIATGVAISSLRHLFPSGQPQEPQHRKDPEPLPIDGCDVTVPSWLPESGELALGAHKRMADVIVCIQQSPGHPGFYDAAVVEAHGGVEGTRRPMRGSGIDKYLRPRWGGAGGFDWQWCPTDPELWAILSGAQP